MMSLSRCWKKGRLYDRDCLYDIIPWIKSVDGGGMELESLIWQYLGADHFCYIQISPVSGMDRELDRNRGCLQWDNNPVVFANDLNTIVERTIG